MRDAAWTLRLRLRWWWAKTFKTRDYRYVVNSEALDRE